MKIRLKGRSMRSPRIGTAILAVLTASAISAGTFLATPASAQPRGHCYGSGCNGQDPQSTGCATDTVDNPTWTSPPLTQINGQGVTLYLRYSPLCNSNWARLVVNDPAFPLNSLWVENQNGNRSYFSNQSGSSLWSGMVDGSVAARACVEYWTIGGGSLQDDCTDWF
jgi:hypothetical protein